MTARNRLLFALAAEALVIVALAAIALDIAAHRRVERLGGVNLWGYRGPVMRQPRPNEIRIAVVGGDLAFGWGVAASETLAYGVRQLVSLETDRPGATLRPVTAVNLGAGGLPIADYAEWIRRFAYLRPQVICIVVDPVDRRNTARWQLPDRQSAVFAASGYSPMLPLVLEEKGAIAGAGWLTRAGEMLAAVDRAAGPTISRNGAGADPSALTGAIDAALAAAPHVVVVLPPSFDGSRGDAALADAAAARSVRDRRIRVVALGDEPAIYDDDTTLDGFHFSARGHATAAALVAPAVLELIAS